MYVDTGKFPGQKSLDRRIFHVSESDTGVSCIDLTSANNDPTCRHAYLLESFAGNGVAPLNSRAVIL